MRHLEDDYKYEYLDTTLKDIRIGLVLACMLYAAFGILDSILIPEGRHLTWMIRYLVVCPSLLIAVFLTRFAFIKKFIQPMLAILIIISGSGIILMILIALSSPNTPA